MSDTFTITNYADGSCCIFYNGHYYTPMNGSDLSSFASFKNEYRIQGISEEQLVKSFRTWIVGENVRRTILNQNIYHIETGELSS